LEFDLIFDNGPHALSLKDFVPPREVWVKTEKPIAPPRQVCEYCRHLKSPDSFGAAMLRQYDCALGQWTDAERGKPLKAGRYQPKLDFTCSEFAPAFKRRKEIRYG
jgi:hypothetical protein